MTTLEQLYRVLFLSVIFSFTASSIFAADRYSVRNNGNWSNTNMWSATSGGVSGASVPTATDNVIIEGSNTITVNVNAVCANLLISNGSSLTVQGINFTVNGTASVNGTISFTSATGTKTFTGLVTVNNAWNNSANSAIYLKGGITNSGTFNAGSGTYTFLTNNQSITGTISIPAVAVTGITLTNNSSLTISTSLSGTGELLQVANASVDIGGTTGITSLTATDPGNTVIYSGAAQAVKGISYYNLTLSGSGNKTMSGNVSVSGTLTLTAGTFIVGANTLVLNGPAIAGTAGSLSTTASSNLSFGGTSSGISVPSSVANLNNLTVNNPAGVSINGNVTIANMLTMIQGNILTGANTLTLSSSTSANLAYTSGTIVGKFRRAIGLPTGIEYLYPVGTVTVYNPLKINFSNLTAGQLTVQFQPNDIGVNGLPLNDAGTQIFDRQTNGYWTLTALAPMSSSGYSVKLNYSGFSGVDALARILKRTNGGNLALDGTHGTVSGSEITRTGLNGISNTTTDFAIGSPAPRFTSQPSNITGCNSTFSVSVSGKTALTYQWQENNGGVFVNLANGGIYSGANTTSLTISGSTGPMNGFIYRCIVTDPLGYSSISNEATLTVNLPNVTLGYSYSSDITIDPASGSADLTDFPVLININNSPDRDRLRTIANLGHVSNSNGYDIIFTDQNGNKLDHQIESYTAVTGQYVAWVRIPLLSHSSSTTIKMLYGNSTVTVNPSVASVWTSNYKGVWHLNQTNYTDATVNANNGTNNATTNVTGLIAGGRGFNGTTSFIGVTTNGFVPNNNNQSISVWANYSAAPTGARNLISFQNAGASSAIQLGFRNGNTVAWKWGGEILVDGGALPSLNTWHYYVYTYDGTTSRLFVDGVEKNNSTVAPQTAMPSEGNIGRYNPGEYIAASLDEIRFSMSPKSAGWILTEYTNQNNPGGFISLGAETTTTLLASMGVCSTTFLLNQGSPSGGSYSGTGVSGTNFNASAAGAGIHSITYTYTDINGCSNSISKNIVVTAAPSAPSVSNNVCCVLNIQDLTASGFNLRWYTDAGLTNLAGTGTPFATGKTAAGLYTYFVTQTINGCESAASTATLSVYSSYTINTQPQPASVCDGGNTSFSVVVSGYNLSYQWQENSINISDNVIFGGTNSATLILTNPGIAKNGKSYRCIISSSCGASPVNSNSAILTVKEIPDASFSYSGSPYCPNAINPSPTFSAGAVAGTFSSSSGLVFVSSATGQVNISASIPGSYTVINTIPASSGCSVVTAISTIIIRTDVSWTGAISSDWNVAGNWTCGFIPNLSSNIQIPAVANKPTVDLGAPALANDILIDAGSSLTITNNSIRISGTITSNGTIAASTGTIEMLGSAAQTLGANLFSSNTINNLIINNTCGVALLGTLNVTGIVTVSNGNLSSDGNLILNSSVAKTALIDGSGLGNITGNVTMQRYIPSGFGYKYFSSPFQAASVSEFGDDMNLTSAFTTFYKYDESRIGSGWVNYKTPANILIPLTGYAVNFGSNAAANTVDITGIVNNGAMSVSLFNHNNAYTKGFNLAGNPYPSPIDWNLVKAYNTNVDDAVYYFKASTTDQYGGSYSTYINGLSSDGIVNNVIPSMQGFFVHVSDGSYPVSGTLSMNNSVRISDLSHPFASKKGSIAKVPLIRLTARFTDDISSADPMVLYFDEKGAPEFDSRLDALKLLNTDLKIVNLYSLSPDGTMNSINALPEVSGDNYTVPLGIKLNRTGTGTIIIKIQDIDESLSGLEIYFNDRVTGTSQDLIKNKEYSIALAKGEYNNRFFINLSKGTNITTNIPEKGKDDDFFKVYSSSGILKAEIHNLNEESGTLLISNLVGQILYREKVYESGYKEFDPSLKDGLYIVSYFSGKIRYSKKILIQNR